MSQLRAAVEKLREASPLPESDLGRPYPIKISKVDRFEDQPRRSFSKESLISLADSIQTDGQQVPVKVCTHPIEKGRFMLIDGERRWRALQLIHARTGIEPTIDAFIEVIRDPKQHFRKSWIANLLREDIPPLDEAAGLFRLREEGETLDSLARMMGKSTTYIENYLKIYTLPDGVKELMDQDRPKEKRLSITAAVDIARSTKDPDLRLEIARETIQRELNLMDTRYLIEQRTGLVDNSFSRKPSDDYRIFTSFLSRTRSQLRRILTLDFADLYLHRDNESIDRVYDLRAVNNRIQDLEQLLLKIEKSPGLYRRLDAISIKELLREFEQLHKKIEDTYVHPSHRS